MAPTRRQPFSLLGQVVYKDKAPIARVHIPAETLNNDSLEEVPKSCLVSGHLDHVEFDLSALSDVIRYVANAYPESSSLVKGLSPVKQVDDFWGKISTVAGSSILAERCAFVGTVFDFGENGQCIRFVDAFTKEAFWNTIRSVGCEGLSAHKGSLHMDSSQLSIVPGPTVGRFIVVESLSPEVVVALHIALEYYFAVTTSIDLHYGWTTLGKGAQSDDLIRDSTRRARHYTIDFLYVLRHEDRLKLSGWHKQRTSVLYDDKLPVDNYIGRGTTVLQLSEELVSGNTDSSDRVFRPWSILVIPAIPRLRNWRELHSLRGAQLANSTEAWTWAIWYEHELVYVDMYNLFSLISEKVSPPKDFMFNLRRIDELIFDDENYTKSRLYFWAYQSLEIVRSELTKIIRRWTQYRNHIDLTRVGRVVEKETTAPHAVRLKKFVKDMDACIQKFKDLVKDCKTKQQEIVALRDGLYNGSAVLESRNSLRTADQSLQQTKTAIAQGENIKVLTLVSIFFLPLAFVTSVFGMTHLPDSGNMNAFVISIVCICIPAYVVIGILMDIWRSVLQWFLNRIPRSWRTPRFKIFRAMAVRDMTIETTRMAANWATTYDKAEVKTGLACIGIPAHVVIGIITTVWCSSLQWFMNQIPKIWRTPRDRIFREMALRDMAIETTRMANWGMTYDKPEVKTGEEKPKNFIGSSTSRLHSVRPNSPVSMKPYQDKMADDVTGQGYEQQISPMSMSSARSDAQRSPLRNCAGEKAGSAAQSSKSQHRELPGIVGDDKRKWKFNIWDRHLKQRDPEKEGDV